MSKRLYRLPTRKETSIPANGGQAKTLANPVLQLKQGKQMENMILGIHSNIAGDDNDYTGGHAWLTITEKGKTTFYGLWPDAHPSVVDNGDDSDIRVGLEASAKAVASRYYKLSEAQAIHFHE